MAGFLRQAGELFTFFILLQCLRFWGDVIARSPAHRELDAFCVLHSHLNLSLERWCVQDYIRECKTNLSEIQHYEAVGFCDFSLHSQHTGNSIVRLIAAVLFCKIVGIKHIDAAPMDGFYHTIVTDDGITIWANGTMPSQFTAYRESCFFTWGIPICHDWNITNVARIFRKQFLEKKCPG
jgi:hypothetical protein